MAFSPLQTMQEVIKVVTYHTQAIFFISQMERAVPTVCQLLGSKTVSDVQEAMQLVITMNQFHISKADVSEHTPSYLLSCCPGVGCLRS